MSMKQWFEAFWFKYLLGTKQPWSREEKNNKGEISIVDYNGAFVSELRGVLPPELTSAKTSQEIVDLWVGRYNRERIEPRLEVIHSGVMADGRIKMELDWNLAFIKMLDEQNIEGDTEEKKVENYLAMMTRKVDYEMDNSDEPDEAMSDAEIEAAINNMDPTILAKFRKGINRKVYSKKERTLDK